MIWLPFLKKLKQNKTKNPPEQTGTQSFFPIVSVCPRDVRSGDNNLNILEVEVVSLFLVGCLLGSFPKLGIQTET